MTRPHTRPQAARRKRGAVAWPANTLAAFGTALEPGRVVLPGALTTAPFVRAGQRIEARFDGVGPVSVSFV